jgi:hypothetical protein
VTLLEQHLELRARHQECASSLLHVQTQFSEYKARLQQELQETRHKYDKLADKITTEDQIFRNVIDYRLSCGYGSHECRLPSSMKSLIAVPIFIRLIFTDPTTSGLS